MLIISGSANFMPDENGIELLSSMGFTRPQAIKALKATDNNIERAADWIFSHQAELDAEDAPGPQEPEYRDGNESKFTQIYLKIFHINLIFLF